HGGAARDRAGAGHRHRGRERRDAGVGAARVGQRRHRGQQGGRGDTRGLEHRAPGRRAPAQGGAGGDGAAVPSPAAGGRGARRAPSATLNVAKVMTGPLPAASSNTVPAPTPLSPRYKVVPKRSPARSITRPESGLAPLVPVKLARGVMMPLPAASSNTVPRFE